MTSPSPDLTRNPTAGTYGFQCTEHGVHRHGLTQQHAINIEAKHWREHHDPMAHLVGHITLDLTLAAMHAAAAYAPSVVKGEQGDFARDLWEALTGLPTEEAKALALYLVGAEPHVTAAVIP